ncbi:MAG TPA: recombinase family protein [Ktedonobacteraceae bacterium]|nr:recombinase family protein [Ktedonobacteraceae bacterium]
MLIGYARVSTDDQTLDLQLDALQHAGCPEHKTYTDKISAGKSDRPGLKRALDQLRAGDTLVVWRLDRLGRSLQELIGLVSDIHAKGADFKSLTENMDTTTSTGKLVFQIFGSFAEFERNVIRERTNAGLKAARARGRMGGRPRLENSPAKLRKIEMAKALNADPHHTIEDICETLHISRSTLYRWVNQR